MKTIKEYREKEELNIEKIVNDYSGYLYTVIKNIASVKLKEEDIEEMIADAFFVIWKNQKKLSDETKISAYLVGIAKNLWKERTRKIKNESNLEDYENSLTNAKSIDEICEEQESIKQVEQILQKMSKEDNQIFRGFYYAGKKVKQLAKELNITEFKVKTKLHRMRKKIKQEMEGGY